MLCESHSKQPVTIASSEKPSETMIQSTRIEQPNAELLAFLSVVALTCTGVAQAGSADRLMVRVPKALHSPFGRSLDDPVWQGAAWVSNLAKLRDATAIDPGTAGALLYDSDALYVAFRCPGKSLPSAVTSRDGPVWSDESVEVFLVPEGADLTGTESYHFLVNTANTQTDTKGYSLKWNAQWESKVDRGTDGWTCWLAIPFKSLGVQTPQDGDMWKLNLCRSVKGRGSFSWSPIIAGDLHRPWDFGRLTFGGDCAGSGIGEIRVQGHVVVTARGPADGTVEWQLQALKLGRPAGQPRSERMRMDASGLAEVTIDAVTPGTHDVSVAVHDADGQVLNADRKTICVHAPLELTARTYPTVGVAEVLMQIHSLERDGLPRKLRLRWQSERRGTQERVVALEGELPAEALVDLGATPPGRYEVEAQVQDEVGAALLDWQGAFEQPDKPEWAGTDAGKQTGVLKPWTALRVRGRTIEPWGRVYQFRESLFPESVSNTSGELLATPISLRMRTGGRHLIFRPDGRLSAARLLDGGAKAELEGVWRAGHWVLRGKTCVEIDGMIRVDWSLESLEGAEPCSVLLEVSLHRNKVKAWGRSARWLVAEKISDRVRQMAFHPYVWLGDEEGGLAWFTESDEHWCSSARGRAIEIVPDGERVTLRLHLQDKPALWSGPRSFTMGFVATPVKPWPDDLYTNRQVLGGLTWGMNRVAIEPDTAVSYPLRDRLRGDEGTLELWLAPKFDMAEYAAGGVPWHGYFNHPLLEWTYPDGLTCKIHYYVVNKGLVAVGRPAKGNPRFWLPASRLTWRPLEWHHLAWTWGANGMRLFVDGKAVARHHHKGLPQQVGDAQLKVGGLNSPFLLDAIRISDCIRTELQGTARPTADEHTLLLDLFDGAPSGTVHERARSVASPLGHALDCQPDVPCLLDKYRRLGVKCMQFFEHWTPHQGAATSPYEKELRRLVKACHERDIKVLVYLGFELANVPEYWPWIQEAKADPNAPPKWYAPRKQQTHLVSYAGPHGDYVLHHAARLKREVGIDGVYLDGSAHARASTNLKIGCGYRDEAGRLRPTYPVFATRQFVRRLNALFAQDGGLVVVHNMGHDIYSVSFATNFVYGENLCPSLHKWEKPTDLLTLDQFPLWYQGRNVGVPGILLVHHVYRNPDWCRRWSALSLLHGVTLHVGAGLPHLPQYDRTSAKVLAQRQALVGFGVDRSEWWPYWRISEAGVTCVPTAVRASGWRREDGAWLLVVSNLSTSAHAAEIQFGTGAAPPKARATDALTRVDLGQLGAALEVPVSDQSFRLLRVEAR